MMILNNIYYFSCSNKYPLHSLLSINIYHILYNILYYSMIHAWWEIGKWKFSDILYFMKLISWIIGG